MHRRFTTVVRLGLLIVLLTGMFVQPQPAQAAVPAGFSEFYIPGTTDQLFALLRNNDNDPDMGNANVIGMTGGACSTGNCNQMHNVITVVIAVDNTTVYYDHWEINGYGSGSTGYDERYQNLSKGTVLVFESSDLVVPRTPAATCTSTFPGGGSPGGPATRCYDGGDRIYAAGGAISVAQAFWPEVNGTVYANAWEIYPVKPYQTTYVMPVGENLFGAPRNYLDFDNVYVLAQATSDGTVITIDDPAVAGVQVTANLNKGQTTQYFHANAGTTVTGSKPVQVQFIVGRPWAGAASDSRSYTAVPSGLWDTAYYAPVPSVGADGTTSNSPAEADIFIYNPTASNLLIKYQDRLGSGSFTIPPNATRSYSEMVGRAIPTSSAAYLAAANGTTKFWAIGSYDTENADFNYGFSLIPASTLEADYYIGWAPGTTNYSDNGSPVHVTPTQDNTTVFVDYSPTNGTVDATYVLDRINVQKIYDPDNNNTGMRIWATAPIALVWGEEDDTARDDRSNPYIDAGYAILPLKSEWIDIVVTLDKSANPSSISPLAGQVSLFTVEFDAGAYGLDDVYIKDVLPANWAYVPGTTSISWPGGSSTADPSGGAGPNLSWGSPASPLADLLPNQTLTLTYQARTTAVPANYSINTATGVGTYGGQTFEASDATTVVATPPDLSVTKTNNVVGNALVNVPFTWFLEVLNSSGGGLSSFTTGQVVLRDNLPAGPTYGPVTVTNGAIPPAGTGSLACSIAANVLSCSASGGTVTLPTGASFTVSFPVTPAAVGALTNPAAGGGNVCRVDPNTLIAESDETNNNCSNSVTVVSPSLSITKTANPASGASVNPGSTIQYTITINNTGGTAQNNIVVNDPLPAGTTYSANSTVVTGSGVTKDNVAGGAYPDLTNGVPPILVTTLDNFDLAVGGSMTVTYSVTVNNPTTIGLTSILNTASVSSDEQLQPLSSSITHPLPSGSISGQVRNDVDRDGTTGGIADAGDSGLANATVTLYTDPNQDGNPADGVQVGSPIATGATGNFSFSNIPTGYYVVVETDPANFGSVMDKDGDTTAPAYNRIPVGLPAGSNSTGNNFLDVSNLGTISGFVLADTNNDNTGDVGVSGVTLTLYSDPNGDGNPADGAPVDLDPVAPGVQSTALSAAGTGSYAFTNVPAGAYVVVETQPAGYLNVSESDTVADLPVNPADAAPTTNNLPVNLAAGETDDGNTFVEEQSATITGFVLADTNNDDAGDAGIGGVTLTLFSDPNGDGNPIDGVPVDLDPATPGVQATAISAVGTGSYTFTNVQPAAYPYIVVESQPTGYLNVAENDTTADNPLNPSDAAPTSNNIPVNPFAGETDSGNTFVEEQPGSILIVEDSLPNDAQDFAYTGSGPAGYNFGGGFSLDDDADGTLPNTRTFSDLTPGAYSLVQGVVVGWDLTNLVCIDSDSGSAVNIGTRTASIDLDAGETITCTYTNTKRGSINGSVYDDRTGTLNDDFDAGDIPIQGVTIGLYVDAGGGAPGAQVGSSVTTLADGSYSFTNIAPGNYVVVETDPGGYISVRDINGDTTSPAYNRIPVTLTAGATSNGNNFLDEQLTYTISGQVRYDADNDGNLADAESGLANGSVSLWTDPNGDGNPADGAQVGSTITTNATGNYSFTGLLPGSYVVVEVNPAGYSSTADSTAPNDDRIPVVLTNANSAGNIFLDTILYSISGQVRYDVDNDGNLAEADSGLANADLSLYTDPNGDGDPGDGIQIGAPVTTTGSGNYVFSNLTPGNYVVLEVNPTGYLSTADSVAPNNDRVPVVITTGSSTGNDFLDTLLLSISGQVRYDIDNDGNLSDADSGLANADLSLSTDPNGDGDPADGVQVGTTVTTTGSGNYSFSGLIPGNYVLVEVNPTGYTSTADSAAPNNDRIPVVLTNANSTGNDFLDTNVGNISGQVRYDADNDGNLADSESGLASAQVSLFTDPDGNGDPVDGVQVGSTVTTDGSGNYTFLNLTPGNYVVVEVNPVGYISTADSAAPNNDRIPLNLSAAGDSTGNDFLDTNVGVISGQVRNDVDRDGTAGGIADAGDSGLANATVTLYTDPNRDGNPADGIQVGSPITTGATGNFSFSNIPAGDYVVVETDPADYISVMDKEGDTTAPAYNQIPVGLAAGANSTGNNFLDVSNLGTISGFVLADTNNDNTGDSGVVATLTLYSDPNSDGNPADGAPVDLDPVAAGVQSTVTSVSGTGSYAFTNVPAGAYVVVETQPAGYLEVSESDSTADLPVNPADAASTTNHLPVNLAAGETDDGNTFVEEQPGTLTGHVYYDRNADGSQDLDGENNIPGDADDEVNLANVSVLVTPSSGASFNVFTNASGDWTASVTPGSTTVNVDETDADFTGVVPAGFSQTEGTDPQTVTASAGVTISTGNDGYGEYRPIANDDTPADVAEDSGTTNIPVLGNDNFGLDGPSTGTITITSGAGAAGTATVNDGGSANDPTDDTIDFTPAANYNGPVSITYEICDVDGDCDRAVVTFNITPVDDVPVANDDAFTTPEDTTLNGDLKPNNGTAADVPSGDGGNVWSKLTDPAHGTASVDATGTFTYIPNANYTGSDTFTYQICDLDNDCDPATVTITINPTDDPITADNESYATPEDTLLTVNAASGILPGDSYPDGLGTLIVTTNTTHGTLTLNAADGSFTYMPDANYNGTDSFEYEICDADTGAQLPVDCATATVDITINSVDDAPVANNDDFTTAEDTPLNGDLKPDHGSGADVPSGDGGNVWSKLTDPAHGTVTVNADGTFRYVPTANYTGSDSFTYQICDADNDCDPATVNITIDPVDDAPVAENDSFTAAEDTSFNGDLQPDNGTGADVPSGDGGNVWSKLTDPAHGTVTVNADGTFTYVPAADYSGPDTFTYEICDADNDCDPATVNIMVNPADDPVTADNENYSTPEDTLLSVIAASGILPGDTYPDGFGTLRLTTDVTRGTLTLDTSDGSFTYMPNANYSGSDSFEYELCDVDGDCATGIVAITINPVDETPTANDDNATTNQGIPVTIDQRSNDDFGGDGPHGTTPLVLPNGSNGLLPPSHGSVSLTDNGTPLDLSDDRILYTPNASYYGTDTFEYRICDADGDCDPATVTINIQGNPQGLSKIIVDSNRTATTDPEVAIGEIVTYQVTINIPPGTFPTARLVDTMERGLSFMNCISITGAGLTTSVASGLTGICTAPTVDNADGLTTVDVARRVTFDFGTLTNNTGADQTLVITYRAVVLDSAGNMSGISIDNGAEWAWAGGRLGPVSATVVVVEADLSILKTANPSVVSAGAEITMTLTIQHTADSETDAFDVVVSDALPAELQYVPGSLECTSGAQDADLLCAESGGTITAQWSDFVLGSGDGRVTFRVTVVSLPAGGVTNTANVAWTSLPGDVSTPQNANVFSTERDYDPGSRINVYGNSHSLTLGVPASAGDSNKGNAAKAKQLPSTGFAPNQVTDLSMLPRETYTATHGVTIEIPSLGIEIPIVGVPLKDGTWNVSWLGNQAGWLQGSAFPSWKGNSWLTGHVYGSNGLPGPFVSLNKLKYGDRIIVHAYGQVYTFAVQTNTLVEPNDVSALKHEAKPWLTLITCKEYDDKTNTYRKRVVVRAALISVAEE